jgi:hypothetical protein
MQMGECWNFVVEAPNRHLVSKFSMAPSPSVVRVPRNRSSRHTRNPGICQVTARHSTGRGRSRGCAGWHGGEQDRARFKHCCKHATQVAQNQLAIAGHAGRPAANYKWGKVLGAFMLASCDSPATALHLHSGLSFSGAQRADSR